MGDTATTGAFTASEQVGERLDRALQAELPALSRTAVQRLIESGGARVGGKPARAGYRLRPGDTVEWEEVPLAPDPSPLAAEAIPLDVVYEDGDVLVLDKPVGLVVHPAPGHATGTLVNAVLAHAAEDLSGIGGAERPGLVHRLDKDTSGLMVVAKSELAFHSLQAQIAAHTVERRYLALVRGGPRWKNATVDAPIGRHPTDRKRMAVIPPGSERTHRESQTDLTVLERFPGFTLLEARLHTGRTHQIRVHCAYIRLPVVGDETYGPNLSDREPGIPPAVRTALAGLRGQALHAYRLAFEHPRTGERVQFLRLPRPDFAAALAALGSVWQPSDPE